MDAGLSSQLLRNFSCPLRHVLPSGLNGAGIRLIGPRRVSTQARWAPWKGEVWAGRTIGPSAAAAHGRPSMLFVNFQPPSPIPSSELRAALPSHGKHRPCQPHVARLQSSHLDPSKYLAKLRAPRFPRNDSGIGDGMVDQPGFSDLSERLAALSNESDPLERLGSEVNFERFRTALEDAVPRADRAEGDRPPYDHILMSKMLVLQKPRQALHLHCADATCIGTSAPRIKTRSAPAGADNTTGGTSADAPVCSSDAARLDLSDPLAAPVSSTLTPYESGAHGCQILQGFAAEALRYPEAFHPFEILIMDHALLEENAKSGQPQKIDKVTLSQPVLRVVAT
jgi:hypothetical protein